MEPLIKAAWPESILGDSGAVASTYQGANTTVVLTDRYFRAIAKIGFHYFLAQFPEYSGHEPMFSAIRSFILEDGSGVHRANDFVGRRQHPLLGEMLDPRMRPEGWQAHVLCAETTQAHAIAHVQMFVSEDWQAPAYTVFLALGDFVNCPCFWTCLRLLLGWTTRPIFWRSVETTNDKSKLSATAACSGGHYTRLESTPGPYYFTMALFMVRPIVSSSWQKSSELVRELKQLRLASSLDFIHPLFQSALMPLSSLSAASNLSLLPNSAQDHDCVGSSKLGSIVATLCGTST